MTVTVRKGVDVAQCDVIVVGAGFAGIYALHQAHKRGLTVHGFESGSDVGGTWFWNSYPGARCDLESYAYSYFFDDDLVRSWNWTEVCASQPEIQRYLRHVAERCDVIKDIRFDTRIESAHYDEPSGTWTVTTNRGDKVVCRYLVLSIGSLSEPKAVDISGIETFAGEIYYTSAWPKDRLVELAGKRVGIIGTGSSGVQAVPEIAAIAGEVYVFQRTANYVLPNREGSIDASVISKLREDPASFRTALRKTYAGHHVLEVGERKFADLNDEEREAAMEAAWAGNYINFAFPDYHLGDANRVLSEFIQRKMFAQVDDPVTAERLTPRDHPFGGKRPCVSSVYLPTFNEPHVHLVSLKDTPITRIDPAGVVTTEGTIELDVLVCATGFDAITGPVMAIDIRGIDGATMRDEWADGPRNYLGTMVHGFPNMFLASSAMTPSVLSNMATLAEQQGDFIFDTIAWLHARGDQGLHPTPASQESWRDETLRMAERRPGAMTTNSWYNGANIPGKPRVFLVYCGGFKRYHDRCVGEHDAGFPGYEHLPPGAKSLTNSIPDQPIEEAM
ncbi:flavin-containing monooxygenase [Variovorax sp. RHLX14]|uniref:flavin-containing monooxygenase n=1 Tax=Variovorax sp. RHLX14 TaxID=1259731 RepID=UPI003F48FEEE